MMGRELQLVTILCEDPITKESHVAVLISLDNAFRGESHRPAMISCDDEIRIGSP